MVGQLVLSGCNALACVEYHLKVQIAIGVTSRIGLAAITKVNTEQMRQVNRLFQSTNAGHSLSEGSNCKAQGCVAFIASVDSNLDSRGLQ